MTNAVLLDNVTHNELRVKTGFSAKYGDNINQVLVFPTEFAFVQREYPIFFRKDEKGEFQAVALLGLDKGENLFLREPAWNARYIPAVQQRGPFLIGLHTGSDDGSDDREPMIHVDLDDSRISFEQGTPVFLQHGGNSPYLEHVSRMLQIIYQGTALAKPMFNAFEEAGLIESMEAEVMIDEQVKYKLPDFFTINQDRLAALDGDTLERLNRQGYLQLAMLVVHSLGNVDWLIELKKRKVATGHG